MCLKVSIKSASNWRSNHFGKAYYLGMTGGWLDNGIKTKSQKDEISSKTGSEIMS